MRFRLRTLLIVTALSCCYAAWAGHCWRMHRFHTDMLFHSSVESRCAYHRQLANDYRTAMYFPLVLFISQPQPKP